MTIIASLRSYLYHKPIFFNLFDEAMDSIVDSSNLLSGMASAQTLEEKKNIYLKINKNKLEVKSKVETLFKVLQENFITPYDRDDIFSIAIFLRKISDNINGFAKKTLVNQNNFINFEFNPSNLLKHFALICIDLKSIVAGIRDQDNLDRLLSLLHKTKKEIGIIEDDIEIYTAELLNDTSTSPKEIIKVIELFKNLIKALDGCEKEIFVIESIVVKYQ